MERLRALLWLAVSSEKQATADKISLVEQERAAREWCAANGHEVVGVLSVPGESRSESDVLTIFEDFAEKEVYAYHDLRRMWQPPRQFDILVTYHDTRLGRSEALYTYVISNVMKAGAQIYCILGGWYEPKDYKLKMAIGMINVSSEMDRFVHLTRATNLSKAAEGRMVHGYPCFGYKVERGAKGEALRKIVDESQRSVIEAGAGLVIEGVGWKHVETVLHERYGYGRNIKPFNRYTFYYLFHNANFWGNEIITTSKADGQKRTLKAGQAVDLWVFDPSYPLPPQTQIFYGVLPAFLNPDEEMSELLKAELRRRRLSIRGAAKPRNSHKFTGLLACYYCGHSLVFHPNGQRKYPTYLCNSKYNSTQIGRCAQTRSIQESTVQGWFTDQLAVALANQDPKHFLRRPDEPSREQNMQRLEAQIKSVDLKMDHAIDEQLEAADDDVRTKMRERIVRFSGELQGLRRQLNTLQTQASNDTGAAVHAFKRLTEYGNLDAFWTSGDNNVNQILHGLLGEQVIVVRDQAVKGAADRPK